VKKSLCRSDVFDLIFDNIDAADRFSGCPVFVNSEHVALPGGTVEEGSGRGKRRQHYVA
jgi:hypothetical protein